MKYLIIALLALFTFDVCNAQITDSSDFNRYRAAVLAILSGQSNNSSYKTTATGERLICSYNIEDRYGKVSKVDSIALEYSGNRGSKFDFNKMEYNYGHAYKDDYLGQKNFSHPDLMVDKSIWFKRNPNADTLFRWGSQTKDFYPDGNLKTNINGLRYEFFYNNNNLVAILDILEWDVATQQWAKKFQRRMAYNSQNNIITDSFFTFANNTYHIGNYREYDYDLSGNLIKVLERANNQGTWHDRSQYLFEYYNNNKLKVSKFYDNSSQGLKFVAQDSFGYQNNVDFYTYMETKGFIFEGVVKHLNSNNLPDTVVHFSYFNGNYYIDQKTVTEYSPSNLPIKTTLLISTIAGLAWRETHYEYETYNTTSIVDRKLTSKEIIVYPNPANEYVSINLPESLLSTAVHLQLCDYTGKPIISERITPYSNPVKLSVKALTSGNYLLSVNGASTEKISILK